MAMTPTPVFVQNPKITPASWTNSDAAATKKTVATAGSNGSKLVALIAATTDTTARVFKVYLNRASTSYLLGSATVAITAGADGATGSANLLGLISSLPRDNDGQPYLFLESGDILQVENVTQVTSAKQTDVVAVFGNF